MIRSTWLAIKQICALNVPLYWVVYSSSFLDIHVESDLLFFPKNSIFCRIYSSYWTTFINTICFLPKSAQSFKLFSPGYRLLSHWGYCSGRGGKRHQIILDWDIIICSKFHAFLLLKWQMLKFKQIWFDVRRWCFFNVQIMLRNNGDIPNWALHYGISIWM